MRTDMTTNWIAEQREAYAHLLEEGVTFTFSREEKGAYDPVRGAYERGETRTFTAPGIVTSPGSNASALAWQNQALAETGDEVLVVGCGGCGTYEPKLEDRVYLDGETWAVKGLSSLRPGLTPLLRRLLVRRA